MVTALLLVPEARVLQEGGSVIFELVIPHRAEALEFVVVTF